MKMDYEELYKRLDVLGVGEVNLNDLRFDGCEVADALKGVCERNANGKENQ